MGRYNKPPEATRPTKKSPRNNAMFQGIFRNCVINMIVFIKDKQKYKRIQNEVKWTTHWKSFWRSLTLMPNAQVDRGKYLC